MGVTLRPGGGRLAPTVLVSKLRNWLCEAVSYGWVADGSPQPARPRSRFGALQTHASAFHYAFSGRRAARPGSAFLERVPLTSTGGMGGSIVL